MTLNYQQTFTSVANLLVIEATNTSYVTDFPNIIDDAELRIYRDLDLLNTVIRDSSSQCSTSTRTLNLPSGNGTFVVVDTINVITPAATAPDSGTRNPLTATSKEMLDNLYPSSSGSTVPAFFAMISQTTVIFGPWPDQNYVVEVVGTIRPPALSTSVSTTLLSWYFPDLFLAACMVRAAGFQKNYGAAVDDPKMAVTWESIYQSKLPAARTEEGRKRFNEAGWSSKQPAPDVTPPRT